MVSSGVAYMEDCRTFSNSVKDLAAHFEKGESVSVSIQFIEQPTAVRVHVHMHVHVCTVNVTCVM